MQTLSDELNLDNGWGIGEQAFAQLTDDLESLQPRCIVEFGSGPSSIRLAMRFPNAKILSIEHSEPYRDKTLGLKERFIPQSTLEVSFRPLVWQLHGLALYRSYKPMQLPDQMDAVIIDGPPSSTLRGREACLYQVVAKLRIGGRAYLDDYARPAEKQMADNWSCAFPGCFRNAVIPVDHQICIFEKVKATSRPTPKLGRSVDAGLQALRILRAARSQARV